MWLLTGRPKDPNAQGAPAPITILLPTAKPLENGGITYVVGRKDVDICIPADKSLSRSHAELMVSGEGFGSLTIRDMQSKFGVVVGESRLGADPHALTDGASLKLGTTLFTVQRVPLVLCTSGIAASERPALKAAAAKLGAALAKEWHDGVTHLVMPTVTWTPKLLTALAACVPVVSPAWVLAAAARSAATDPLPPIGAPEFAPTPAPTSATTADLPSGATTIEGVQPERKRLFAGKALLCLPNAADGASSGGAAAATQDICRLLERMGAQIMPWPSPAPSSAKLGAYIAARAAEGVWFLTSGDETKSVSREAEAVLTAGGTLYTPLLVRTSLVRAALQAPVRQPTDRPAAKPAAKPIAKQAAPSAAVGKPASPPARAATPPSRAPAADVTMAEAEDASPAAASPHVPSGSSCEPASPADAQAATQVVEAQRAVSGPPPPAPAMARAPAPAPAADKGGWNQKRKKDPPGGDRTASPATYAVPTRQPAADADDAEAEMGAAPAAAAAPAPAAAEPQPAAPRPPAPRPVVAGPPAPEGWLKRPRSMFDGSDAGAEAPAPPTHSVGYTAAPVSGKAFKKVGARGPGSMVRVRMETVMTGRDGPDELARDGEEAPADDANQQFAEAVQQVKAAGGRRRAR
jgi:hypothetical protein